MKTWEELCYRMKKSNNWLKMHGYPMRRKVKKKYQSGWKWVYPDDPEYARIVEQRQNGYFDGCWVGGHWGNGAYAGVFQTEYKDSSSIAESIMRGGVYRC